MGKLEEQELTLENVFKAGYGQHYLQPVFTETCIGNSPLDKEDIMKQHAGKEKPADSILQYFSLTLL